MSKVLVVGGGAAGMFAAITAADEGHEVELFEKNEKLGKKLFITGKGRCNLTNACELEDLFQAVISNAKFLYSSFYGFTNAQTMDCFEKLGLRIKVERGDRVFPLSDHSSDVIRVLERALRERGVRIHLRTQVKEICQENGSFIGIRLADERQIQADACIVATGGLSYPSTGSTGDGYRFAEKFGHSIVQPLPGLVPMKAQEKWVPTLQGLALKNVAIVIKNGKKKLYEDFGEMLFTHFGVSGPMILSASSYVGKHLEKGVLPMTIDLKPALSLEQLDDRILRDFQENQNRQFHNSLSKLYPSKLLPVMVHLSEIPPEKKVNEITKEERRRLAMLTKNLPVTLTGLRGFEEAIITKGGIKTKEIDPSTMQSKLISGLYFAGEVLDLDAKTGGFNLQIAWSTAYTAGKGIL